MEQSEWFHLHLECTDVEKQLSVVASPFIYVLQYSIQPTSTWKDIKLPNKESILRGVKMIHYENPTVMPRNRKQA